MPAQSQMTQLFPALEIRILEYENYCSLTYAVGESCEDPGPLTQRYASIWSCSVDSSGPFPIHHLRDGPLPESRYIKPAS